MSTLKENVHDLFDGWNTIPNWLSFIRIALIPVFAVLFVQGHQLVAVIVMIMMIMIVVIIMVMISMLIMICMISVVLMSNLIMLCMIFLMLITHMLSVF